MQVATAVRLYMDARRVDLAQVTRRKHRYALEAFADHAGKDRALRTLKRKHVEDWISTFKTAAYAGKNLSIVRGFTAWCVVSGHLTRDPCAGLKGPRRPRLAPRECEPEEVDAVLEACPDTRARLIVTLAFYGGLRRSEIAALQIADIDRRRELVHIIGKNRRERFVPLSEEIKAALHAYLSEHPTPSGPLIRSYQFPARGLHPDTITIMVSRIMRDAGVKKAAWDGKSAHAGRHTSAGNMLDQGADPRIVQEFLGHEHLGTTWVYTKRRVQVDQMRPFTPKYPRPPAAVPPEPPDTPQSKDPTLQNQ